MVEIQELLGDLFANSDYYWLNPSDDPKEYESLDLYELREFTDKAFDILRKKQQLKELIPFIMNKLEIAHQILEYYEEILHGNDEFLHEIYSVFNDIFEQKKLTEKEFVSLEDDFFKYLDSGLWEEVEFGLDMISLYRGFLSTKAIEILCNLLFHSWDDIEYRYDKFDYHEISFNYEEDLNIRNANIANIIYSVDKQALVNPLQEVFKESLIDEYTSWDKLVAAEYLVKIDKKKWLPTYFKLIFENLTPGAFSEIERKHDHKFAKKHFLKLDQKEAIDLLVEFFKDSELTPKEILGYKNEIKIIARKNDEMLKYFIQKVRKLSNSFPFDEIIKILAKE
ncbi:MAG: hypothetical protein ACTSO7_16660 [Candidatus Heimdallarchaeota archaeon]